MTKTTSKLIALLFISLFLLDSNVFSQNSKNYKTVNYKDTVMHSWDFITNAEADRILGKPSQIKDSAYRFSSGLLRYKFEYVATYKDSTSKGRIFFMFEQYADTLNTTFIFNNLKKENEKDSKVSNLNDIGTEAFLALDNLNYPFILIRKDNKLFKFKLYYLDGKVSLDELLKVAKKIVLSH